MPIHVVGGRPRRLGSRLADRRRRRAGRAARDAARPHDRRPQDRRPGRARVLQLVPLRRLGEQRRRPAARGDAARRLADPRRRRPPQAAGRRRAGRRSRRLLGRRDGAPRSRIRSSPSSAARSPACRQPTWDSVIVATGPLTSPALSEAVRAVTGEGELAFFDAIAPIIHREVDRHLDRLAPVALRQGRPGGTGADYLNCPMTREEYDAFIDALLAGDKTSFKEWEASTPYFDGCLPIEVMAERGRETLRFGPMKPVGLDDPRTGALALRRRAAAPGQCARHAVEHGRLPDQAEARRAGAHLPHDPRARRSRVCPPRRPAPQHVPQQPQAARRVAAPEGDAAPALCRTDHRRRRLCRKRRHRPARGTLRRGRAARPAAAPRRRRRRRSAHSSGTSPAGISPPMRS